MKGTLAQLPVLVLMGCALPENFIPAERATAVSPEGYAAAHYEIVVEGERLGDVAVWTNGARLISTAGGVRTALYVTFHVDNRAAVPLQLDPESIRIRAGDRIIGPGMAQEIHGARTVPPGRVGWLVLRFILPPHVDPQELDAFVIEWTARAGDQVYAQRTPFLEYEAAEYEYPYPYVSDLYYSPFDERFHFIETP